VTSPVTPSEGILGPVSGDGKYDNANASITGNAPHNPFVNGSATYTFTVPTGVTVSDVFFQFGTTRGANVSAPEPASILFLGLGLVGLPLLARRRS
jgi:PEP-CTERM motif